MHGLELFFYFFTAQCPAAWFGEWQDLKSSKAHHPCGFINVSFLTKYLKLCRFHVFQVHMAFQYFEFHQWKTRQSNGKFALFPALLLSDLKIAARNTIIFLYQFLHNDSDLLSEFCSFCDEYVDSIRLDEKLDSINDGDLVSEFCSCCDYYNAARKMFLQRFELLSCTEVINLILCCEETKDSF